ncbi:MAG: copper resistance system multicopper oxidase, partial [Pseudomonadota bacterium]
MKNAFNINRNGLTRRQFVLGTAAAGTLLALGHPRILRAAPADAMQTLRGNQFDLNLNYTQVNFTGQPATATTVNGGLPGPILRWKQGDTVTLRVTNQLAQHSSVHWHGIILPTEMDGVPGMSFDGIHPGQTFEYRFKVQQSGTYWYHSHSHMQEQTGLYGAIVIDPAESDPVQADRDYVVMLSDWSDDDPEDVHARLKKMSHYYNFRERTAGDLWRDIRDKGVAQTWNERAMWNRMRMSENDISDVNGYAYTFLMNGQTPAQGWNALFKRGEKVRLRFINAAAMTFFDVRIPGLKMTVVAADGQLIDPVTVDEFRMGVAETYDVIVEPKEDMAYCIFAQSIDRTGYARGNLTPDLSLQAEIPAMDPVPVLGHGDMGMNMDMSHGKHAGHDMAGMDHSNMDHSNMDHGSMNNAMPPSPKMGSGKAGFGSAAAIVHAKTESGPQVDMIADAPQYKLDDPGIGLRNHRKDFGRRVLTYYDLCNYYPTPDPREPGREIQLHLTG